VRGPSRNIELDRYVATHGKIKIDIDDDVGKPVCTFATKFALAIGTLVRNTIPLKCDTWRVVPIGVRELVIDRLEVSLCFFYAF